MTRLFLFTITFFASFVTPSFLHHTTMSRHLLVLLVHVAHLFTSPTCSRHHLSPTKSSYTYTIESLLGQEFKTMFKARNLIKQTIIDAGLSYKKLKSKLIVYFLAYKDNTYIKVSFIICTLLTKHRLFSITRFIFTTS